MLIEEGDQRCEQRKTCMSATTRRESEPHKRIFGFHDEWRCLLEEIPARTKAFPPVLIILSWTWFMTLCWSNPLSWNIIFPSAHLWYFLSSVLFSLFQSDFYRWASGDTHLYSKHPTHLLSLSSCCPLGHERHSPSTIPSQEMIHKSLAESRNGSTHNWLFVYWLYS